MLNCLKRGLLDQLLVPILLINPGIFILSVPGRARRGVVTGSDSDETPHHRP